MTTKYYEWGNAVGGGGVPGIPAEAPFGPIEEFADNIAALALVGIEFSSTTKSVKIQNTHDTALFYVSFDMGGTFRTIGPYGEIEEAVSINGVTIICGDADSSYYVRGTLLE